MATAASVDEIQLAIAAAVDADFYRDAYPEIADLGATPCSHYADAGWREGRDFLTYEDAGAAHDERAWRARIAVPLEFLLGAPAVQKR